MTDSQFLTWIRDRLVHVYGEPPNVDFVLRLEEIIDRTVVLGVNILDKREELFLEQLREWRRRNEEVFDK